MGCAGSSAHTTAPPAAPDGVKDHDEGASQPGKRSGGGARGPSSPYKVEKGGGGGKAQPKRRHSTGSMNSKRRETLARMRNGPKGSTQWTNARRDKIRGLGKKKIMGNKRSRSRGGRDGVDQGLHCGTGSSLGGVLTTSDFIMDSYAIGKGSFGFVILAKHKANNMTYALKQTRKVDVVKKKGMKFVIRERKALRAIDHPFIVKLCGSFQDRTCVYLVLEYIPGGDLGWLLFKHDNNRLPEEDARFYASEIIVALQHLHSVGYMHRDVKPENVLLDRDGHVKLGDFGFAKAVDSKGRCFTNLGTPHYLAPEQLDIHNKAGYSNIVDWWSFACLVFCLAAGECPFGKPGSTRYEVYLRVMKSKYKMARHFSSPLKKMLKKMFVAKAEKRLCTVDEIRSAAFFESIDWARVESRSHTPPYKPDIMKNGKNNFDKVQLRPLDDENDMAIVEKNYDMFAPFDR